MSVRLNRPIIFGLLIIFGTFSIHFKEVYAQNLTPIPQNNKINWKTNFVSLEADNFYISTNGKVFLGDASSLKLNSDPPGNSFPKHTTLEAVWMENGVEMRVNIYFEAKEDNWWSYEIRTYDGYSPGDWIYHRGNKFYAELGKPHVLAGGILSRGISVGGSKAGIISFDNLKVQAFLGEIPPKLSIYDEWRREFMGIWNSIKHDADGNKKVDLVDFEILRRRNFQI